MGPLVRPDRRDRRRVLVVLGAALLASAAACSILLVTVPDRTSPFPNRAPPSRRPSSAARPTADRLPDGRGPLHDSLIAEKALGSPTAAASGPAHEGQSATAADRGGLLLLRSRP